MRNMVISMCAMMARILIIVIMLILIVSWGKQAYSFGYRVFAEKAVSSGDGVDVTVEIPSGASASEIGEILEDHGLIRDAKLFSFQEKFSEYSGKLKGGTYELSTAMTAEEMMEIMAGDGESSTEETSEKASSSEASDEGSSEASEEVTESN
ncbi:MAG: endolytic transglycosylase MltG [Lachnospiraceae bacterium]|nr:endolytic transglycosylase MltG [Lachnospiraceae bacterium]